jgi:tetratricopeptide (TPR) repeat protein
VFPGSAGERAGLTPGSVVVSFDRNAIEGADRATLLLRTASDGPHTIEFRDPAGHPRGSEVRLLPSTRDAPLAFLEERVRREPGDLAARYVVALLTRDPNESFAASQALAGLRPNLAANEVLRARALIATERSATGVPSEVAPGIGATLERAISLDPTSAELRAGAANAFLDLGDRARAYRLADQAVKADPSSARANGTLGAVQLALHRPLEAIPVLRQAVRLDPYTPSYYQTLASAYRGAGQERSAVTTERAVRMMEQGTTDLRPGPGPGVVLLSLGMVGAVSVIPLLWVGRRRRMTATPSSNAPPLMARLRPTRIAELLVVTGFLVVLTPFLGPALGFTPETTDRLALLDHVLPGIAIILTSLAWLVLTSRKDPKRGKEVLAIALLVSLWTAAAHAPLLVQAVQGNQSWGTSLFHSFGPTLALGLTSLLSVADWWAARLVHARGTPTATGAAGPPAISR